MNTKLAQKKRFPPPAGEEEEEKDKKSLAKVAEDNKEAEVKEKVKEIAGDKAAEGSPEEKAQ